MEESALNLAILADRLVLGGLETHIITFINELLLRGYQILLCTEYALPDIVSQITGSDQAFRHVNGFSRWEPAVKQFKPDIIHAHPFAAISKGVDLSSRLRIPLVVTIHGFYDTGLHQKNNGKPIIERVSRLIAVDEGVAAFLQGDIPGCSIISVIYNGISLAKFQPLPYKSGDCSELGLSSQRITVVALSRLDDDKTRPVFQLINCASALASRLGGINLIIVGDGNMFSALKNEADMVTASNSDVDIAFTGRQLEVTRYLTMADLVVACDRAAVEAMACGRPVFAANGTGFADLIDRSNYREILCFRRGYLPISDAELTTQLADMLLSRHILQQAAANGVNIVSENFDIREKADQLECIYHQLQKPVDEDLDSAPSRHIDRKTIRVTPIKISVHK